jgi:putative ABC transport system ATP-binding protein
MTNWSRSREPGRDEAAARSRDIRIEVLVTRIEEDEFRPRSGADSPSAPPPPPPPPAAQAVGLEKVYGAGQAAVRALAGVDLLFAHGRFTAVMGPSGSGKSTLMHCMAGLDRPTAGQVFVGGQDIGVMDDTALTEMRRDRVGFVFQSFNLVPTLTAGENITLPADLAGRKVDKEWFDYLVAQLGIGDRLSHRPTEMSGGQQQRCACARALINRPALVFADEPTGNLDSNSTNDLLEFLRRSVTEFGQSIAMVTHDPHGAAFADRVVFLDDGLVVDELTSPTADTVLEHMRTLAASSVTGG